MQFLCVNRNTHDNTAKGRLERGLGTLFLRFSIVRVYSIYMFQDFRRAEPATIVGWKYVCVLLTVR